MERSAREPCGTELEKGSAIYISQLRIYHELRWNWGLFSFRSCPVAFLLLGIFPRDQKGMSSMVFMRKPDYIHLVHYNCEELARWCWPIHQHTTGLANYVAMWQHGACRRQGATFFLPLLLLLFLAPWYLRCVMDWALLAAVSVINSADHHHA